MNRLYQNMLIGSVLAGSWFGMMATHEAGHVLGAWLTGGRVTKIVIHPLAISRTDVRPNPMPLIEVWSGPIAGILIPLLIWILFRSVRIKGDFIARFFLGFCLIANGAYLGLGSWQRIGDAGDLLRHGAQEWQLWLFGLLTIPTGFIAWHGLGPRFGLGNSREPVDKALAWLCLVGALAMVVGAALLSPMN